MRILIDARLYSQSGVGRYIRKLIANLAQIDKKNQYLIYLIKEDFLAFKPPAPNFAKKMVNIHWHSLKEQLVLPFLLIKESPDLVHFPYFSLPVFYPGKFVVTIHDLIIDHFNTGRASTRSLLTYKIKRLFYKFIVASAIKHAVKVIAVSRATKEEIVAHYHPDEKKVLVTYEAADLASCPKADVQRLVASPYLLYVGNAYPHKNLSRLIAAFQLIKKTLPGLKLVLVGKKDYFYQRLEKSLSLAQEKGVVFFGFAKGAQLSLLYSQATLFVFPSLMEGFGLPGLEAMAAGLPVAAAGIPALKEVYGQAALYFNMRDPQEIAHKISELLKDKNLQKKLIVEGQKQVAKYSWEKMARETLAVYNEFAK